MSPRVHQLSPSTVKRVKDTDPFNCWQIIKDELKDLLFGSEYIILPFLQEALRYDLNAVVMTRRKSLLENITFRSNRALAVNMLPELIRSDISTADSVNLTRPNKINVPYHSDYLVYGNIGRKTVALRLKDLSVYQTSDLPESGQLMLDMTPYFEDFVASHIYLITKVIYVKELRLRVLVNDHIDESRVRSKFPVAFQLTKFNVEYNAILGNHERVEGHPGWRWIKYDSISIPRTLLVERENRGGGDDGKRRNGPRNVRRRSILRDLDVDE